MKNVTEQTPPDESFDPVGELMEFYEEHWAREAAKSPEQKRREKRAWESSPEYKAQKNMMKYERMLTARMGLRQTNPRFERFAHKIGFAGWKLGPLLTRDRAYFLVAPELFLSLFIGWAFVTLSALTFFRPASAGAVLVTASLVAEYFHLRWPYLPLLNMDYGTGSRHIFLSQNKLNPRAFRSLARPFHYQKRKPSVWLWKDTAKDAHDGMHWPIFISLFAGTIIWGYGDLFMECRHFCA